MEPGISRFPDAQLRVLRFALRASRPRALIFSDRKKNWAIVISTLDSLVEGSSGKARQNMSLMHSLPETAGLERIALFPSDASPIGDCILANRR